MTWRQARPYPVVPQLAFVVSFVLFLVFQDRLRAQNQKWIWIWSGIQVLLGVWLVRGRLMAKRQVLRCIRCSRDLP